MKNFIEIQWASGSIDEARKVARYLVQERFVASAQIIPWIESIYMWNNQLETTQETLVILKSTSDFYENIKEIIMQNCKYQIPEITFKCVDGGNQIFMDWVEESIMRNPASNSS